MLFKNNYKENIPWNIKDVAFVYVFVVSVVIFLSSLFILMGIDETSKFLIIGIEIFSSLILLYAIYLILKEKYNTSIKETFGIKKSNFLKAANQGAGIFFILLITTTLINIFIAPLIEPMPQDPYSKFSSSEIKTISVFAILTAPIVEEVFFRGFMQPAFIKRFGVIVGIVLTAIIFSISHAYYLEYNVALLTVFTIGLVLGIAKYKTKSIMPVFFAHFYNNIFAAMLMF